MDGQEPSRLNLGDVRSQRGGKERQKAPEDTVLYGLVLFFVHVVMQRRRCFDTTRAESLQHNRE